MKLEDEPSKEVMANIFILEQAGINVSKKGRKAEKNKGKPKLFNFLLIFFVSILSIAIIGIFIINEDTKLMKIIELKIYAVIAIIGIILLYLSNRKKPEHYHFEGRGGEGGFSE